MRERVRQGDAARKEGKERRSALHAHAPVERADGAAIGIVDPASRLHRRAGDVADRQPVERELAALVHGDEVDVARLHPVEYRAVHGESQVELVGNDGIAAREETEDGRRRVGVQPVALKVGQQARLAVGAGGEARHRADEPVVAQPHLQIVEPRLLGADRHLGGEAGPIEPANGVVHLRREPAREAGGLARGEQQVALKRDVARDLVVARHGDRHAEQTACLQKRSTRQARGELAQLPPLRAADGTRHHLDLTHHGVASRDGGQSERDLARQIGARDPRQHVPQGRQSLGDGSAGRVARGRLRAGETIHIDLSAFEVQSVAHGPFQHRLGRACQAVWVVALADAEGELGQQQRARRERHPPLPRDWQRIGQFAREALDLARGGCEAERAFKPQPFRRDGDRPGQRQVVGPGGGGERQARGHASRLALASQRPGGAGQPVALGVAHEGGLALPRSRYGAGGKLGVDIDQFDVRPPPPIDQRQAAVHHADALHRHVLRRHRERQAGAAVEPVERAVLAQRDAAARTHHLDRHDLDVARQQRRQLHVEREPLGREERAPVRPFADGDVLERHLGQRQQASGGRPPHLHRLAQRARSLAFERVAEHRPVHEGRHDERRDEKQDDQTTEKGEQAQDLSPRALSPDPLSQGRASWRDGSARLWTRLTPPASPPCRGS